MANRSDTRHGQGQEVRLGGLWRDRGVFELKILKENM
jgi:hypothetical protein